MNAALAERLPLAVEAAVEVESGSFRVVVPVLVGVAVLMAIVAVGVLVLAAVVI